MLGTFLKVIMHIGKDIYMVDILNKGYNTKKFTITAYLSVL